MKEGRRSSFWCGIEGWFVITREFQGNKIESTGITAEQSAVYEPVAHLLLSCLYKSSNLIPTTTLLEIIIDCHCINHYHH